MLTNISYNPNNSLQAKFLGDLVPNKDNSMSIASSFKIVGDLNKNYLNKPEKQNIEM